MNDEQVTIEDQFIAFAKLFDDSRTGSTITLYNSDFWLRQAKILDDMNVTMTDTGTLFTDCSKTEFSFEEWRVIISELCSLKQLDEDAVMASLLNCGLPDPQRVEVPAFRNYFTTYQPKSKYGN
ncbi:tubulin polymerization-promoting protein homolog [Anticarsia gemmatalis]|uniref:tubulin polymerization-promoting protein homolog n=1 Tax=Anticarsia gemmatalis TaxID=129554 RepID=UPI003F77278A